MSEKNFNENMLNDDTLEGVNGGAIGGNGINEKKGLRVHGRVGLAAQSTLESQHKFHIGDSTAQPTT